MDSGDKSKSTGNSGKSGKTALLAIAGALVCGLGYLWYAYGTLNPATIIDQIEREKVARENDRRIKELRDQLGTTRP